MPPLTDKAKRTLTRWIDLGCPIDLNPKYGWHLDDDRPVLTLAEPIPSHNGPLHCLRIGMNDYGSGLDLSTFTVTSTAEINGHLPGENLAPHFKQTAKGVWELPFKKPLPYIAIKAARWTVSIRDKQGNETRLIRMLEVPPAPRAQSKTLNALNAL